MVCPDTATEPDGLVGAAITDVDRKNKNATRAELILYMASYSRLDCLLAHKNSIYFQLIDTVQH